MTQVVNKQQLTEVLNGATARVSSKQQLTEVLWSKDNCEVQVKQLLTEVLCTPATDSINYYGSWGMTAIPAG